MTKRHLSVVLAVLVLLVSGGAGCGGGDSSSPTSPTAVETATPRATATGTSPYGVCAVTASDAMLPPTFVVAMIPEGDPLYGIFQKCMKVFGTSLLAFDTYPDDTMVHVATVTAEYLDNNEDGIVDNMAVNMALQQNHASFFLGEDAPGGNAEPPQVAAIKDRREVQYIRHRTDIFYGPGSMHVDSSNPGGTWCGTPCGQRGDGEVLEHVPELIQKAGYATAYPSDFGPVRGSTLGKALEAARGGYCCEGDPAVYPESAWFIERGHPYDGSFGEYFFWGLATHLGMLGDVSPGVCARIANEWKACTRADFIAKDTILHSLLTNSLFSLPQKAPNGSYR